MRKRDRQLIELSRRLDTLGISLSDQEALRRIEMALHRWAERECNGEVQRDEETGRAYGYYTWGERSTGESRRYAVADKERGALKRLIAIMANYPALWYYHQGDPRGCALYVGRWDSLPSRKCSEESNSEAGARELEGYYTLGIAVCL